MGRRHATRVTWLSHGPYATLKAAGGWCGAPARHGHSVRAALRWPLSAARPGSPPPRRSGLPRGAPTRSGGRPPPRSRTRLSEPRGPRTPSSRGVRMAPSEEQFSRQVFGRKTNERCPTAREDDAGFKCRVSTQRHGHGGSRARPARSGRRNHMPPAFRRQAGQGLSRLWGLEVHGQGAGRAGVRRAPSRRLTRFSRGGQRAPLPPGSSSHEVPVLMGPTLATSSNPSHRPEDTPPNASHWESGFQPGNLGGHTLGARHAPTAFGRQGTAEDP